MANTTIVIKKSATPSSQPTNLANGELAINYADGKLFYKNATGQIVSFTSGTNSFGTVNANGTLIVADTIGDILTLEAGNNITITADSINDKITISASGGGETVSITTAQLKDLTTENTVVTSVASFTGTVVDSTIAIAAFDKANAGPLAANAYALTLATAGNNFTIALQNGSNTAVGAGANAYSVTVGTAGNNFTIALQNGSNTAVGAGANAYSLALATAGNNFTIALQNGSNTAVGTGANAYAASISNTIAILAFNQANAAFEQANTGGGGGGTLTTFTSNVGDGSANTFNVSHQLNSYWLLTSVRELSTGDIVYPDMRQTTANNLVITFVDNPTSNQYALLVAKVA